MFSAKYLLVRQHDCITTKYVIICLCFLCREEGNTDQALKYLDRAINADRTDITLRYRRASLHIKKGEYSKAAESYDQVVQICPNNVEALKTATKV